MRCHSRAPTPASAETQLVNPDQATIGELGRAASRHAETTVLEAVLCECLLVLSHAQVLHAGVTAGLAIAAPGLAPEAST